MKHTTFVLVGLLTMVISSPVFAVGENTVTSKSYVDTQDALKQNKLHTASATPANNGTTVVTYTDAEGTPGERGIAVDFSGFYGTNAETGDMEYFNNDELVTGSWVRGAIESSYAPSITTTELVCYNPPACTLWLKSAQRVAAGRCAHDIDCSCPAGSGGTPFCTEDGFCSCTSM